MSTTARTDDIDALVSSVRDFVAHKEPRKSRSDATAEKLVLTDDQRVVGMEANGSRNAAAVVETIASLEAAITTQPDAWDDDYTVDDFTAASDAVSAFGGADGHNIVAARIEKVAEAQALAETSAAFAPIPMPTTEASRFAAEQDAPDTAPPAADGLGNLDQDGLRALVAEIVHDELAGELGERITRNVRKLVRREINRALTSRSLLDE